MSFQVYGYNGNMDANNEDFYYEIYEKLINHMLIFYVFLYIYLEAF